MSTLIIVEPMHLSVTTSRGTGVDNLSSRDPKEVWADSEAGSPATLMVDLGAVRMIDTIFLGYVTPADVAASWSIMGGAGSASDIIQVASPLRVPDVAGSSPATTHALWFGAPRALRYLAIAVTQPAGAPPLTAGVIVVGKAFIASLGQEWGAGRQVIDTGSVTSLPSGGFAVVDGARKRLFKWSFGDLSIEETDQLELIAVELGMTVPGLVVEDVDRRAGMLSRLHYGLFKAWQPYERRNRRQTRWEISIEEWA